MGEFLGRRSMEEVFERVVRDASLTGVCAIIPDVVDGVDDESVEGSEVEGEGGGFELAEAVPAREVSAEVDVEGKSGLL